MYRPLTKNDLATIAAELIGTDNDLQTVMSELGLDIHAYGETRVLNWLCKDCGLVAINDQWMLL